VHRETPIYTLTNDDMDHIGYQVWDVMEEIMEEATRKQEEKQQRVQDQLEALQQLLVAASLEKESRMREDHPLFQGKEAESVHSGLDPVSNRA
jgi:hypothetical protein